MKKKTEAESGNTVVSIDGKDQFHQLISNFFDILVLIDRKGCQHYVSSSCEKILGYTPDELLGVSVIDAFIHPEDQESARSGLWDIISEKKNGGTQYRHRHKAGGWVYLEAFGTNQLDNPSVRSVVLNVRDITERKKTEEELQESRRRLKDLNTTKDRLFSIIGHDLRNPVGSILGLSELMLERLRAGDYTGLERYTKMIHHSASNAVDLLANLLAWARSQTGGLRYQPRSVDLETLAARTIDLLDHAAGQKAITLENRIPAGTEVWADPVMIELIIRNLLSNGIKFTPDNGTVGIRTWVAPDEITVFVEDSGVGISGEDADRLFLSEYNYSSEGTRNEAGTGLGLLLCKEFVGMHGGNIRVESTVGKGSTFSFTIPRNLLGNGDS
ncbi:MAG TPA: PAS domain-containing sensor histidine kinase [Oceanipulchritudo sp.]|nr:PAS domain-containing sensor histidine kinase [Oceanipulchritudo sp.]